MLYNNHSLDDNIWISFRIKIDRQTTIAYNKKQAKKEDEKCQRSGKLMKNIIINRTGNWGSTLNMSAKISKYDYIVKPVMDYLLPMYYAMEKKNNSQAPWNN